MNTKTNRFLFAFPSILVICIGLTTTFCKDISKQKVDASALKTTPPSDIETTWVDPLFFIEGQLCQHVRKIFQDSHGNLWIGTNIYGLMRYNGDTLVYYDESHGLGGGRITGIVEDEYGSVWFGTAEGLSRYDPTQDASEVRFTNFAEAQGLPEKEIWSLMLDKTGLFWIGTLNGVYQFDGHTFEFIDLPKTTVVDTSSILSFDRITSIIQDQAGGIWFGRDGFGITRLYQNQFQQFTRENGLSDNGIHSLMEDQYGNVWIGTMYGGLSRWHEGNFTRYPFGNPIVGWEIGALFEDSKSQVWFASENHGVYKYDPQNDSFDHLYKEQGLPTSGILSIYEDQSGRFWMGGWGGLFRYFPEAEDSTQLFLPVTVEGPWQ